MSVRFCPFCRSLILSDFRFCPYCGESVAVRGPELAEALDGAFKGLEPEAAAPRTAPDVFAGAEERLGRLEADMNLIIDGIEREGRKSVR